MYQHITEGSLLAEWPLLYAGAKILTSGIQIETDGHSLKTHLHCRRGSTTAVGVLQGAQRRSQNTI